MRYCKVMNCMHYRKLRSEHTPPISPFWGLFLSMSSESKGSILLLTELEKTGLHFLALGTYFWAWYPTLTKSNPLENGALLILPLSGWSWILRGQLHWWVDIMFIVSFTHCHSKCMKSGKHCQQPNNEKQTHCSQISTQHRLLFSSFLWIKERWAFEK